MKKSLYTILLILIISTSVFGQFKKRQILLSPLWTTGTALSIPPRQWDIGLFQPLRYGLTPTVSLSAHPLWFFLMPNLRLKKQWKKSDIFIATRHQVIYPSFLLKNIAREGTGGILPANTEVPQILIFSNEILFSTWLKKQTSCTLPDYLLTLKLGVDAAYNSGDTIIPTIDLPLVYHRTATYHKKMLYYAGLDLEIGFHETINYSIDVEFMTADFGDYAVEHKALIVWNKSDTFKIMGGYKISYGKYPYGTEFRFFPMIDLLWIINPSQDKERDLFNPSDSPF